MKAIINKFNSSVMQIIASAGMPQSHDVLKGITSHFSKGNDDLLLDMSETVDDLVSFTAPSHMEELERYWVDEPYCLVCVLRDRQRQTIHYHLVEPKLNKFEKTLLEEFNNVMGDRMTISNLNGEEELDSVDRYTLLRENTKRTLTEYFDLHSRTFEKIYYFLKRDFIDFGSISGIMKDTNIEDVWCNGVNIPIFVYHKAYGNIKTNVVFSNDEDLDHFVTLIAQQSSRHLSRYHHHDHLPYDLGRPGRPV